MEYQTRKLMIEFYENELAKNILPFWLNRCEDKENGGYFNCFTNDGTKLMSTDKYTWSQGRFVWLFAKLSSVDRLFSKEERAEFLRLAKIGRDFLVNHCFMQGEPFRCAFLMDEKGDHKHVDGYEELDMSIYADGFVLAGLSQYALISGDAETYQIAKKLYESIMFRYDTFSFRTLPYPISEAYIMHGFYMNRLLHCYHMLEAANRFDTSYAMELKITLKDCIDYLFETFVDEENVLREVVYKDGGRVAGVFGNHCNPGHILEDLWFILHSADVLGDESYTKRLADIAKKTLENGWDKEYGGLLHYCSIDGGEPIASDNEPEDEVIYQQVMNGWGDKLWWVHSEALYTTLILGERANDEALKNWYQTVFDYTFRVFPNPDKQVGEWIQIQTREGKPQTKVVALPVKDPFHIARNILYILLFLYRTEEA